MTAPNRQPLSREEHLRHVCAGVLKFLDRQIAEMEKLTQPWEANEMKNLIEKYEQVAFALRLALVTADKGNA
jgi:hypothetical protein